ncbi:MAG: T9SS type A sorting domain-containing protein [Flavobacteriales bacterium]|nr:T9SS type A sorting domain-containing protein [Flavobacteriales bacterium]
MKISYQFALLLFLLITSGLHAQFDAARLVYPNSGLADVRAVDLDGDGATDIIGIHGGHHLKWTRNSDGIGSFAMATTIISFNEDIVLWQLADLDQDLDTDVILVREGGTTLELLRNNGDGTFGILETVTDLGSIPAALIVADVNGDGFLDLIATIGTNGDAGFAWLSGSAAGFGTPIIVPDLHESPASTMLEAGDLDLIGGRDLVLHDANNELLFIRNVAGDASSWVAEPLPIAEGQPTYPYNKPQLLDVDGDGDLDLAESRGSAVHWLKNGLNEGGVLDFSEHLIEPWTTSGNGVFSSSPCGVGASVVYAPGNPALPMRWNAYVPLLNDFSYSNDLDALPRGNNMVLADLDNDGKEDLVMNLPNGTYWFPNIIGPPTEPLVLPSLDTLCLGGPAVDLPTASPAGGLWYGTQVLGTLLFRSNITSAQLLPLVHVVYADQGCPMSDATSIRLIEAPQILNTVPAVICSNQAPIQMTSSPVDVAWYGLDGASILDPAIFAGGYVRCEFTDATGHVCSSLQGPIQRWNSLPAEIAPAGPFCEDDTVQIITAAAIPPLGSSWGGAISGSAGNTAFFDPSIGAGEHEIILYANPFGPNQCPNSDTLLITVSARPVITFTPMSAYCISSGPITLGGALPADGFWSGNGVLNGVLDPSVTGPGIHLLSYYATSPEGCGRQAVTTIELADTAIVQWNADDLVFCREDDPVTFTGTPAGGTWAAPITADGTFDPGANAFGQYPSSYSYTDPLGCTLVSELLALDLRNASRITMDTVGVLCANGGGSVELQGSASGVWSGAVQGEGTSVTFDPVALGPGVWTVTLTAAIGEDCPGTVSQDIVVEICTGIVEQLISTPTVAPNPFQNSTRISLNAQGMVQVDVMDATGRIVHSNAVAVHGPTSIDLDLAGQATGAYTVRIRVGDSIWHMRAVKGDR